MTARAQRQATLQDLDEAAGRIRALHDQLAGGDVEDGFLALRELALGHMGTPDGALLLEHPLILPILHGLRCLSAQGEAALEKRFAREIAERPVLTAEALRDFTIHPTYAAITGVERGLLSAAGASAEAGTRYAFLGCGAWPMSAVLLAETLPVSIDLVEWDSEAAELADGLVRRLGLAERLTVMECDASTLDLSQYDAVWLAALLENKGRCLARLAGGRKPALVMRGVEGSAGLMYHPMPLAELAEAGYALSGEGPALPRVINRSYVFTAG
jgi:hypothetical protein